MFLIYPADTDETLVDRIGIKLQNNTAWFGTRYPDGTAEEIVYTIRNHIRNGETKFFIEGPNYKFHVHLLSR